MRSTIAPLIVVALAVGAWSAGHYTGQAKITAAKLKVNKTCSTRLEGV